MAGKLFRTTVSPLFCALSHGPILRCFRTTLQRVRSNVAHEVKICISKRVNRTALLHLVLCKSFKISSYRNVFCICPFRRFVGKFQKIMTTNGGSFRENGAGLRARRWKKGGDMGARPAADCGVRRAKGQAKTKRAEYSKEWFRQTGTGLLMSIPHAKVAAGGGWISTPRRTKPAVWLCRAGRRGRPPRDRCTPPRPCGG